jgi:dTMP kinase
MQMTTGTTRLSRGILIVLEGIDGGGKTTQAENLLRVLQEAGYEAAYFREPSDSRWGRFIREKAASQDSLTPDEELELFQQDRRNNVEHNLRPALAEHKVVILDRYYFSTMAYQGAKGMDPEKIREANESFAVIPDLVFILDVDPALGLQRIEGRRRRDLLFEREDYLKDVRAIFLSLEGEEFFHIDARRSAEEVSDDIASIALDYLAFFINDD